MSNPFATNAAMGGNNRRVLDNNGRVTKTAGILIYSQLLALRANGADRPSNLGCTLA